VDEEQIKGKWHQLKGEIKRKWGALTEDELTRFKGDVEKLIGRIQEITGESKEAIRKWFRERGL
jgi:uncharacterized protein YjbJ (UPF0337 family)